MKLKVGKKGLTFADLSGIALLFVLTGVTLGIGAYVNSEITTTAGWASTSTEYLAVANATSGIATLSQWLPIGLMLGYSSRDSGRRGHWRSGNGVQWKAWRVRGVLNV